MHKNILAFLFLAIIVSLFTSCKKETIDLVKEGKEYFPVSEGKYISYQVDSIHFNDVTVTSDTTVFQVKEVADSLYIDDTGAEAYVVKRYRRTNDLQDWNLTDVWFENVNEERAEKVEENLRFIKLVFPVLYHKTWKGNSYLPENNGTIYTPDWDYYYSTIDTTYNFNTASFDSCIIVTQYDVENLVKKDIERESYAKNIGLIYKESIHVERQTIVGGSWMPLKGTIVIFHIIDHN